MNVHFIAIGGSAMHNLAIALYLKGYKVTGSDDQIFDPSKSRLKKYDLLPEKEGWNENNIHTKLDAVIVGMHAKKDNPELKKAIELGIKTYSYPEYIFEQTKLQKRIVIGGSHGKTSITSMILHVCNQLKIDVNYMVGAQLEGFECMVKLKDKAKYAIIEGDEYLASPLDRRPKFHLYQPDIAILTGIAWDHINVFPTFENYVEQFDIFIQKIESKGSLIYYGEDKELQKLVDNNRQDIEYTAYTLPQHTIEDGITYLKDNNKKYALKIFGKHNLQNINAALLACMKMGISKNNFYESIQSFKGASKRLELLYKTSCSVAYKDFAHSPSKLKATTNALKEQYSDRQLVACMELHTFSSLNKDFLIQYKGSMQKADIPIVYLNPDALTHKNLPDINKDFIQNAFAQDNLQVFFSSDELIKYLQQIDYTNNNLLLMSSGNFNNIDLEELAQSLLN